MPKRQRVKRFDSTEVQGEGSFVTCSSTTLGEQREIGRRQKDGEDMGLVGLDVLRTHILQWNWVDDDGEPMPQVSTDPDILDELTDAELEFLMACIGGANVDLKN